jgi:hypothetical protein
LPCRAQPLTKITHVLPPALSVRRRHQTGESGWTAQRHDYSAVVIAIPYVKPKPERQANKWAAS